MSVKKEVQALYSNIKILDKFTLVPAAICGIFLSIFIGLWTYHQASPNFDKRETIATVRAELNIAATQLATNAKAIGQDLSAYNKKIANARLLMHYSEQDMSELTDPELIKLKGNYKETAVRPFAVREYGIAIAILIGGFSMALTIATFWLLFWLIALSVLTWKRYFSNTGSVSQYKQE